MLELRSLMNQNKNQTKKIVNISKCSPSTSAAASSSSSSTLLLPSHTQATILNIPIANSSIPSQITPPVTSDSRSLSPSPTIQSEAQVIATLTNSARKRRKQEFKPNPSVLATRISIKSELRNADENNNECRNGENEDVETSGDEESDRLDMEEPRKKILKTELNDKTIEDDLQALRKGL